jgi:hypothetical protein
MDCLFPKLGGFVIFDPTCCIVVHYPHDCNSVLVEVLKIGVAGNRKRFLGGLALATGYITDN